MVNGANYAEAGFRLYEILGTILVNKVCTYVVETLKLSKKYQY